MIRWRPTLPASLTLLAALTVTLTGCGQYPEQSGPLTFGLEGHADLENQMCIPRSYLDKGLLIGDIATNDSPGPAALTGLTLVDPEGVIVTGAGAAIIPEDRMGFYARPLSEPVSTDEVPTPPLSEPMWVWWWNQGSARRPPCRLPRPGTATRWAPSAWP
jgi:predicted small lipoprotein YifL